MTVEMLWKKCLKSHRPMSSCLNQFSLQERSWWKWAFQWKYTVTCWFIQKPTHPAPFFMFTWPRSILLLKRLLNILLSHIQNEIKTYKYLGWIVKITSLILKVILSSEFSRTWGKTFEGNIVCYGNGDFQSSNMNTAPHTVNSSLCL